MYIAIGDIHGEYDKLVDLMEQELRPNYPFEDHTYVFLGDFVDGGRDTRDVIETLIAWEKKYPHWVFLKGNHEDLMLNALGIPTICETYIKQGDYYLWWCQGGRETHQSYLATLRAHNGITPYEASLIPPERAIPVTHINWLRNLKLYHETENHIFVHAGLKPGFTRLELMMNQDFLWIRDEFIDSDFDWGKMVVFGHTAFDDPIVMDNKIGIDTMRHGHGHITAVVLDPDDKYYYKFIQSF